MPPDLLAWLISTGVAGSVVGALGKAFYDRHISRRVASASDAKELLRQLMLLRRVQNRRVAGVTNGPTDEDVIEASLEVKNAALVVGDSALNALVTDYIETGRLYASGDPATGFGQEEAAYNTVTELIADIYRKNR